MTTYLERLKARALQKDIPKEPSKPSKGAFEGFDGDQGRRVSKNEPPESDARAAFDERSAIAEHDGGLARTEADLLSAACVVPLREGETAESRQATVLHFAEYLDRLRRRRVLPAREPGDAA